MEKFFFVNNCHLILFEQKQLFKPILTFHRIYTFKNVKKKQLSDYFSTPFWDSHFLIKKRSSLRISLKILQNNQKSIFSLYMAHFEVKNKFLLIFSPFNWVDQKVLIILRICHFSNMLRKTNLSIFVFLSEIATFLTKKRSSL